MFCNNHHGVGVSNVLRSFRSHKNLKSPRRIEHLQDGEQYYQLHAPVPTQRPVPNRAHHPRRPSEASSIETLDSDTSFHRPSTSSRREGSREINPLRLHPPTEEDLFASPHTSLRSPPRHHYERKHLGSSGSTSSSDTSLDMSHQTSPGFRRHQAQPSGSSEIYDGFDFGFDSNRTPGPGRSNNAAAGGGVDDYFGIPAQPKSHWSRSPTPTPRTGDEEEDDHDDADETPGAGPGPGRTEWSTPTRPRGRPLEGMASPEYFMKRGDWKRRGIVFTPMVATADEAEIFDLDG